MNIFAVLILLSMQDIPALPAKPRADRRAARSKAIAHNKKVYNNVVGGGIWFDQPKANGIYCRHASGHHHTKAQQGRWETERLSGHRRYAKWQRDYYPSGADVVSKLRWEEELKEYFNS